ncbi:unnamed protein product [Fusarium equiseti]|uniref:Transcription factor n=1 Tax=Fusarium equiseti TaxID=61235 RepID=A0A8J2IHN4_FUSEQ|nr:unnamed protein product [Fusarium equiseti]
MTGANSTQRQLQCPECPQKFSRPSHLSRHQLTHATPSNKDFIPCPQCQKTFSRRDVLLRHLRSTHRVKGHAKRSTQKSCFRCVVKKLKCDRKRPCCNGCIRAGNQCAYPNLSEQDDLMIVESDTSTDRLDNPPDEEQAQNQPNEPMPPQNNSWHPSFANMSAPIAPLPPSISSPGSTLTRETDDTQSLNQVCQVGGFNSLEEDSTIGSITSAGEIPQSYDTLLTNPGDAVFSNDFAISPSYMALMQPNFRTGGFDWLGSNVDDGLQSSQLAALEGLYVQEQWPSNIEQRDPGTIAANGCFTDEASQRVSEPVESTWTRDVEPRRSSNPQHSSLAWPFDQGNDSVPLQYRLPPLRELLNNRSRAGRSQIVDGYIQILSENPMPQLAKLRDSHSIQAFCDLQRLAESYFTRFHDVQSILHKPTWTMSSCPPAMLTAMACIGALLSDNPSDVDLSFVLSDLCSTIITWMGASDNTSYNDVSYLNALCLHQIYSLGSGNRQLYQNADRSRGILIGGLRGIGLLKPRNAVSLDERQEGVPSPETEHALNHEWRSWIVRESGRRAAWAAFEYDCSLCTLTSRRGVVDLNELPSLLPCPESIWNATSAQAWYALVSRLGSDSSGPNLSVIIKLTLAGREAPSSLGSWAKRLCAQVMGRMLWDLWQLEVVAMPEFLGLSSIISAHRESKTSLLKGLNTLVESLRAPSTTGDLISYNIASLLCHYSHLCAANGILDMVVYIVRNLISSTPQQHDGIQVARERLKSTFARDPKTARRLCWHAAQIVAIANDYLVSAPCEIMRVFMGYIFIIAYSTYGPHGTSAPSEGSYTVRLDLHDHHISQRRVVVKWIEAGGPASCGSVQDIGAHGFTPAISNDAQKMLQKLNCWGLATKFVRIFQVLESKGF